MGAGEAEAGAVAEAEGALGWAREEPREEESFGSCFC